MDTTEDRIERQVEAKVDALDKRFMHTTMTRQEYDAGLREIDAWAALQRSDAL